jgi:hypothetical protein
MKSYMGAANNMADDPIQGCGSPQDPGGCRPTLDDIYEAFCEKLDEVSLKHDFDQNDLVKSIRKSGLPHAQAEADEAESAFARLRADKQFGTILAGYIKSEILRPLQRKYREMRK